MCRFLYLRMLVNSRFKLGKTTSQQMSLMEVKQENFVMAAAVTEDHSFKEVFDFSLGQLLRIKTLKVRPNGQPTVY